MRLVTLFLLLLPVSLSSQVLPSHLISTPVFQCGDGTEAPKAVTSNEHTALVVWNHDYTDVMAMRVAPDGTPIDRTGIPVANTEARESAMDAASVGDDFLVAWYRDNELHGTFISAATGEVLWEKRLATGVQEINAPFSLAGSASRFAVVVNTLAQIFDANGKLVGSFQLPGSPNYIAAAARDDVFYLAYRGRTQPCTADCDALFVVRATTQIDGISRFTDLGAVFMPAKSLAFVGDKLLAFGIGGMTTGYRVALLFDRNGETRTAAPTYFHSHAYEVVSGRDHATLLRTENGVVIANQIFGDGRTTDDVAVAEVGRSDMHTAGFHAARVADRIIFASLDDRNSGAARGARPDLFVMSLPATPTAITPDGTNDGIPVYESAAHQSQASVARGSDFDLAVWSEYDLRRARFVVRATRLRRGVPLDGEGVIVSEELPHQIAPSVAFAEGRFLVTWTESPAADIVRGAIGRSMNGTLKFTTPFTVFHNTDPSFADYRVVSTRAVSARDGFLVLWEHDGSVFQKRTDQYTSGAVVSFEGALVVEAKKLIHLAYAPEAVATPEGFVLVYSKLSGQNLRISYGLEVARLWPDLSVASTVTITNDGDAWGGTLATSGRDFLVTWTRLSRTRFWEDRSQRTFSIVLDASGAPRFDTVRMFGDPSHRSTNLRARWDGSAYVLTWSEMTTEESKQFDVFAARRLEDGSITRPMQITATEQSDRIWDASARDSETTVVYSRKVPDLGLGNVERVFASHLRTSRRNRPVGQP